MEQSKRKHMFNFLKREKAEEPIKTSIGNSTYNSIGAQFYWSEDGSVKSRVNWDRVQNDIESIERNSEIYSIDDNKYNKNEDEYENKYEDEYENKYEDEYEDENKDKNEDKYNDENEKINEDENDKKINENENDKKINENNNKYKKFQNISEAPVPRQTQKTSMHCHSCECENTNEQSIILSCNHVFHISCLINYFSPLLDKYPIIDSKFINENKCLVCDTGLDYSEILYIHNKFYSNTKLKVKDINENIDILEKQLNAVKNKLRMSLEAKQNLEYTRDRSRQILMSLNNLD
jgi:hypothetical protein